MLKSDNFKDYSATFKRVANIVKDIEINSSLNIEETLFEQDEERDLYNSFKKIKT